MNKKLESNIWKYAIASVANKRIFVAILGAYYLTIPGVNAQVIGIITLCASIASFLFEIPSGYVSDKIGHKQALIISRIGTLLSSVCFVFADNVFLLIAASVLLSLGAAFNSGTASAFMHDTLRALGRDKDYSSVMGKISSIGFGVPIALTVFIPFFVGISYKIPFIVMGIVDVIGLIAILSLTKPPVIEMNIEEIQASNFKEVFKEAYRLNYFTIATFSGIISAALLGISAFRAPFQLDLGISVVLFGVFIGIGRALASFILIFSNRIEKYFNMASFYRFQYLLHTLLIIGIATTRNTYVVVALLIINSGFHWGLSKIDEGYQLQIIKGSKFKATILSIGSQIESALTAGVGFTLGWVIQKSSYATGFLYLGLATGVLLTILHVRMSRLYKGL
jgi:MFS family permease